jgi:hypothetical protein
MIVVTLAVLVLFTWTYITVTNEAPSVDSGNNLLTTGTMVVVLFILTSFTTLQVRIDTTYLHVKFGYGIFKKKFSLHDITSAKTVRNPRRCGRGIRIKFWPKTVIYNVSGFDAVEITLKNGKRYRIGTDEPKKLEQAIVKGMR